MYETPRRLIRPSSLTTYLDCARRFAARHLRVNIQAAGYDLRAGMASGVGAAVGTGVHSAAGWMLEQKRATGRLGSENDAIEHGIVSFRDRAESDGCEWDDTTRDVGTAEKQIVRMAKVYRAQVAPRLLPVEIEERVEADVGTPGWSVSGQLDVLAREDGTSNLNRIHDTKTGVSARANGPQYGAYALLFEAHGYEIGSIVEDYIARVPLRREQPDALAVSIDVQAARQDAWEAIHAIQRDATEFAARAANPTGAPPHGAFSPNPASQMCSARWCPAHGTAFCRSHAKKTEAV